MYVNSSFSIFCLLFTLAHSPLASAQERQDPPEPPVIPQDAGTEAAPVDAGADASVPPCIKPRCEDGGECSEPEDAGALCLEDDPVYERRVVVPPPSDDNVAGCGCSWYQMSSLLPLGVLSLCVAARAARRARRRD